MKFIINYHTGVVHEIEAEDLAEAKQIAVEGMTYTQQKVSIEQEDGEVLATSYWFGVAPDEDDAVLARFGDYGFYQLWDDELAVM